MVPSKEEEIEERREKAYMLREQSKTAMMESRGRLEFENKMASDAVRA